MPSNASRRQAREQTEALAGSMMFDASTLDDDEPTDEEREAIERAWMRGEELPAGWVVVELGPNENLAPGTCIMLRTATYEAYLAAAQAKKRAPSN